MARQKLVEERRAGIAQMQLARRAWGKARNKRRIAHGVRSLLVRMRMVRDGLHPQKLIARCGRIRRMQHHPWRLVTAALLAFNLTLALAAPAAPRVRVTTSMGDIVIELYPQRAPLTVANFLRYVREGHYTNTIFHRVVGNFVIQGGGHAASDMHLKPAHDP